MKLLVVSPATVGYRWEIEALLTSNIAHGVCDEVFWLAYTDQDDPADTVAGDIDACQEIASRYGARLFYYDDGRPRHAYRTSIRLWLIAKWLRENPEFQSGTYFYADSDMIFTGPLDVEDEVSPTRWIGSQTLYSSLVNRFQAAPSDAMNRFVAHMGFSMPEVASGMFNCPGAQWVVCDPKPEVWDRLYGVCEDAYDFLSVEVPITAWTAEMTVIPWTLRSLGVDADAVKSMDFTSMGSSLDDFHRLPIYHNSLAPEDSRSRKLFIKNDWRSESPAGHHFDIEANSANYGYVEWLCRTFKGTTVTPV